MFLKMEDLRQFNQVHEIAGGIGVGAVRTPRRRPNAQQRMARRRSVVSGLGSNEHAKSEAAETAALLQDVMVHVGRAAQAKKLLKQLQTAKTVAQAQASAAGLQGLGAWYDYINPVNAYNYVVDKTADVLVGPMQAVTGYMVPTQQEIQTAQASVTALNEKIEARTEAAQAAAASGDAAAIAANPPVPQTTTAAAQVGNALVKDMQAARDNVLQLPSVTDVFKYLKWGAIIGGGLIAVAVVLPYIKAVRAGGKTLQKALS